MEAKEIKKCKELVNELSGWLRSAHKQSHGLACEGCIVEARANCEKLEERIKQLLIAAEKEETMASGLIADEEPQRMKAWVAQAALKGNASVEVAKQFYDWIMEKPQKEMNKQIKDVLFESSCPQPFKNIDICKRFGILTLNDLLNFGWFSFGQLDGIGKKALTAIIDYVELKYGIQPKDWKYGIQQ